MQTNNPQSSPLERIARLCDYSLSHKRDLVAVSLNDLQYLVAMLHSRDNPGYKDETPPT